MSARVPTPRDIAEAMDYGRFLRGQDCSPEMRMIADLSIEVERLRAALTAMLAIWDPGDADLPGYGPGEIDAILTARALVDGAPELQPSVARCAVAPGSAIASDALEALELAAACLLAVSARNDVLPSDLTMHAAQVRQLCLSSARDLRGPNAPAEPCGPKAALVGRSPKN